MRIRIIAYLILCVFVAGSIVVSTTAAPTPAQKCLSKKLKEVGKYDSCRLKAEAKGVIRGTPPDFTNCTDKLTTKWVRIESAGGCDFTDDQAAPEALTNAHTDEVFDLLANGPPAVCGDAIVGNGEDCDGANLDGETCVSLGYDSGTLACTGACAFDTSACVIAGCGNGVVDVGEQCDDTDLNGLNCFDFGFSSGVGTLACGGSCDFDTSGCVELCGNGVIDISESCDGANLGAFDCSSFAATGTLACTPSCHFDTSGCTPNCGNGVREALEDCDGLDLGGDDCVANGYLGGTLACTVGCTLDFSGCTAVCGDNVASTGEECDGTDVISECYAHFYHSGTVTCTAGCLNDVSGCSLECGYIAQDCAPGEGCYFEVIGDGSGGCEPAGGGGEFDACVAQNDCASGYYCDGTRCRKFCDVTNGNADCNAGWQCYPVSLPVEPNLGVCILEF